MNTFTEKLYRYVHPAQGAIAVHIALAANTKLNSKDLTKAIEHVESLLDYSDVTADMNALNHYKHAPHKPTLDIDKILISKLYGSMMFTRAEAVKSVSDMLELVSTNYDLRDTINLRELEDLLNNYEPIYQ